MKVTIGIEITPEANEKIDKEIAALRERIGKIIADCVTVTHSSDAVGSDISEIVKRVTRVIETRSARGGFIHR